MISDDLKTTAKWIASFVAIDAILGMYVLLSCLTSPDLCGVGGVFTVGFFYQYPFGALLPEIGSWNGLDARVLFAPVVGVIAHILFGAVASYYFRAKQLGWARTLSIGVSVDLLLSFVPALLFVVIGIF